MDGHSKNVCLIGALYVVGSVIFSLDPLISAIRTFTTELSEDEIFHHEPALLLLVFAAFNALLAITAGLMIRGVFKQRHLLVAPFLVVKTLGLVVLIVTFLMDTHFSSYYVQNTLYSIGVHIMVFYPVYTLFLKLRTKSLKAKSLTEEPCLEQEKQENIAKLQQKLCV